MGLTAKYLDYLKFEKRVSPHTITSYKNDLDQFFIYAKEAFDIEELTGIDATIVRTWVLTLFEQEITARSINRKISALKSFFHYHIRTGSIAKNPMIQVSSPKNAKRLPQFVELDAMEKLFSEGLFPDTFEGWRDRAVIELFYATGMRLSELVNIQEHDLDFYECTVKVLGKRNKERVIPFGNTVKNVLQTYLSLLEKKTGERKQTSFIFVTNKTNKLYPKAVYRIVRKYLNMVTTIDKRSPHVIRHTFATHLLNNGADINAIKEILGHSSLAATQIYTHNSIEKLKSIYKQSHPRA